ncbi:MAG TPA: S8 family serine peptidase [Pyrinomonadaceae bacterium]
MLKETYPGAAPRRRPKLRGRAFRVTLIVAVLLAAQNSPASQPRRPASSGSRSHETATAADAVRDTLPQLQPSKAPPFKPVGARADLMERRGLSTARVPGGGDAVRFSVVNVEFRDAAARRAQFPDAGRRSSVPGVHVLTTFERFADLFVADSDGYDALVQLAGLVRVEGIGRAEVPPPPDAETSAFISRVTPDDIVRGGRGGMTGRQVVIAVVDTGIDFRHPDFVTYDRAGRPTSRLLYLWDSTTPHRRGRGSPAPFAYPNGTSIGTLYTRAQLTAELRAGGRNIPATDVNGHGTACAGIAAGNGNGDKAASGLKRKSVVGVAPEADIIGVRIGTAGLENSYLLNAACEWLDRVAGRAPLVVSGSFGGHSGGHDGQTVRERQLNARFPLNRAGRALVLAAGNEGLDAIHAEAAFGGRESRKLVAWDAVPGAYLAIYFDGADRDDIVIEPDGGQRFEYGWDLNPFTGQLSAHTDVVGGKGGLWLSTRSGRRMKAHLYFLDRREGTFTGGAASPNTLVGAPGTAAHAITVGSYDWNDNFHSGGQTTTLMPACRRRGAGAPPPLEVGKLSCYSSPGPVRFELPGDAARTTKPDIVAPGQWYESSYARIPGQGGVTGWQVDDTNLYAAMNGTSAATPYTAGIVALIFQKKRTLTLSELKSLLTRKATQDTYTDTTPNAAWGSGKLNLPAIDRILAEIK